MDTYDTKINNLIYMQVDTSWFMIGQGPECACLLHNFIRLDKLTSFKFLLDSTSFEIPLVVIRIPYNANLLSLSLHPTKKERKLLACSFLYMDV